MHWNRQYLFTITNNFNFSWMYLQWVILKWLYERSKADFAGTAIFHTGLVKAFFKLPNHYTFCVSSLSFLWYACSLWKWQRNSEEKFQKTPWSLFGTIGVGSLYTNHGFVYRCDTVENFLIPMSSKELPSVKKRPECCEWHQAWIQVLRVRGDKSR